MDAIRWESRVIRIATVSSGGGDERKGDFSVDMMIVFIYEEFGCGRMKRVCNLG